MRPIALRLLAVLFVGNLLAALPVLPATGGERVFGSAPTGVALYHQRPDQATNSYLPWPSFAPPLGYVPRPWYWGALYRPWYTLSWYRPWYGYYVRRPWYFANPYGLWAYGGWPYGAYRPWSLVGDRFPPLWVLPLDGCGCEVCYGVDFAPDYLPQLLYPQRDTTTAVPGGRADW